MDALGELMAEMEEGEDEEEELVLKIDAKISGLTGMRATVFLAGYICMRTRADFVCISDLYRVCASRTSLSLTSCLSNPQKHFIPSIVCSKARGLVRRMLTLCVCVCVCSRMGVEFCPSCSLTLTRVIHAHESQPREHTICSRR